MKVKQYGFTIVELLVTVTIIAMLSVIGFTGYQAVSRGGRDALRKSDLEQIRSALEIYKSENNTYPTVSTACIADNLSPDFVNPYPQDPKQGLYTYCYYPSATTPILSYELCAHLENGDSTTDNCGTASNCGSNCNYSVVNP